MVKRPFFALLGLGAGVALGVYAVRKLEGTRQRLRPEALASAAGARAGTMGDRLRVAIEQGRRAAADKESELRAVYRVDSKPAS